MDIIKCYADMPDNSRHAGGGQGEHGGGTGRCGQMQCF